MVHLEKISSHDALFPQAWKILHDSLPDDECRSLPAHREIECDPRYAFSAILFADRCVGAVGLWRFTRFMFLEHLAVASDERSTGIGSGIVHEMLDRESLPIALEVEPTSVGADAMRRIIFYRTLGFIANEYDYVQPAYDVRKKPVPMLLMTYPAAMNNDMLEHVEQTLYREVYHRQR